MVENRTPEYGILDRPEILSVLFHPRPDYDRTPSRPQSREMMIPVAENVAVGACFHSADTDKPNILFFHGNGEIVADYAELGPLYIERGLNFLVVDYRGYGRSDGRPSVTAMMKDCHQILNWTREWLRGHDYTGPLAVMGRSLGSASALELASRYPETVNGLIIESGFAFAAPLLQLLGISPAAVGFREDQGFGHLDKIGHIGQPTLIIHAEFDHIIPFSDGKALYDASSATTKSFLKIPGANHNDIFARGLSEYLEAVTAFMQKLEV